MNREVLLPAGITCPWCDSSTPQILSLFGSGVGEVLLRCSSCLGTFTWLKFSGSLSLVPDEPQGELRTYEEWTPPSRVGRRP